MTGTAGPSHLKAADGDNAGLRIVKVCDLVLVFFPTLLAVGCCKTCVVECALGVGGGGGVKVVGVVSEGNKLNIRAFRQTLHIIQCAVKCAGAVGILGVRVKLAEVQLILCLADDEVPVQRGRFAVLAGDGELNIHTAVCHVLGGSIADFAVFIGCLDRFLIDGQFDSGLVTCVYNSCTDGRPLIIAGLGTLGRQRVCNRRCVHDIYLCLGVYVNALIVLAGDDYGQLVAGDHRLGNGDGVFAVLALGDIKRFVAELCGEFTAHPERSVNKEAQLIILTDTGRKQCAEYDGGSVYDAVNDINALGNGVKVKGVDGVVGDGGLVHGIDLEAVAVILKPLAVALILCGAAFHLVAAHPAGAGANQPIGVFACGLSIEGVVAGAVCAQVAVGLVVETVVVAAFLNGEHDCTVCAGGLTVLNGGGCLEYRRAFGVAVLSGEDRCGVGVIDNNFAAGCGQTACGRIRAVVDN